MLRGFIKFHCTECGNNFIGPDIEYAATVFSMPLRCPKCQSIRTLPKHCLSWPIIKQSYLKLYMSIWERYENK